MKPSLLAVRIAAACLMPLACKSAFADTPSSNLELPATQVSSQAINEADDRLHLDSSNSVGSRLGLTARETPASVETRTQADLQQKGLRTTKEALSDATGVTVGNVPGNPAVVSMRGFTGNTVNVLQDGVRVAASTITTRDMDTWKYEKIEVLKGPASVLYGEGSLGGTINLVTRKPTLDEQKLEGLLSTGSFGTRRAAIGFNQPLNETMAIRADASYVRSDSFYDVDDQDTKAFNLSTSLLFKPNDELSMIFAFDHDYDKYDSTYNGSPLVPASVARNASSIVSSANGLVIDKSLRRSNYNPDGANSGARSTTLRWTTDYRLNDDWTLSNLLSYYTARREFFVSSEQNYSAATGQFARNVQRVSHDHQFWNERISASNDQLIGGFRNRFSVGAEYSHTDLNNPRQNGTTSSVDPWNPQLGVFPGSGSSNWPGAGRNVVYQSTMDSTSVFAEDAFNLTEDWLLVGGLRYEDINLRRTIEDVNLGTAQKFHPTYDPFSWRVGAVYNLTPDVQLYAQYSTAVTPVSSLLLIASANGDFDLSKGKSVELGFKASLFNGRTSLTGAVYQIDLEDILTRDPNNSTLTVQGGKQRSRGAELSSSTQLTSQLRADLGVSVVDARYEELVEAGGADRSGNHPVNVPHTTANAALIYRFEPVPVTVGAYLKHSSGFYTDTANTYFVDGYTTLDASVSYEMKSATLTLRGRNLTDRFYGEYSGYSSTQIYIGAPRSAELSLAFKF